MQVVRRTSKRKSGLRFWNRALGIKANMHIPRTQKPLAGATCLGFIVGAIIVFMGQVAFAHTGAIATPRCSDLPGEDFFAAEDTELQTLTVSDLANLVTNSGVDITPKIGDADTADSGSKEYHYAKISVPILTAGVVTITSADTTAPVEAVLCHNDREIAASRPPYIAAHTAADRAADLATADKITVDRNIELKSLGTTTDAEVKAFLLPAKRALENAQDALETAGDDTNATALDDEIMALQTAFDADPFDRTDAGTVLDNASGALGQAAGHLRVSYTTGDMADLHKAVDLRAQIASGQKDYIVVVALQEGTAVVTNMLTLKFSGLMSNAASNEEVLWAQNPSATFTLQTNTHGLLMADTMGRMASGILTKGVATDAIGVDTADGKVGITAPLQVATDYMLTVNDEEDSGTGTFTLALQFYPATEWDPIITAQMGVLVAGRSDYYFFNVAAAQVLTLTASQEEGEEATADTQGWLYSKRGRIAMDADHTGGMDFELSAPILLGDYIVRVDGDTAQTAGKYTITAASAATKAEYTAPGTGLGMLLPATAVELMATDANHYFIVQVTEAGWLHMKVVPETTAEPDDTDAVLAGPDGMQVAADTDAEHANFVAEVTQLGQYLLTVSGDTGSYKVAFNFIESLAFMGAQPAVPTEPTELAMACEAIDLGHPVPTQATCEAAGVITTVSVPRSCPSGGGGGGTRVVYRDRIVEVCPTVETDAKGFLGNPPHKSVRSGIGVISGWVCAANDVTIDIQDANGRRVEHQTVGYGTDRLDTLGHCAHTETTTGWGLTYNFNHLAEGTYTLSAYADGEMIGTAHEFEVVHLVDFAADDTDRFLRDLTGMCAVEDFPEMGESTELEWEQSTQNFVISSVMMEEGGAMP